MKKLNILFLLGIFITSISFTSCEKLADDVQNAVEITVNTDFTAPFVATPVEGKINKDGSGSFNERAILDPRNNDDLSPYLDKIKNVDLQSIRILITKVSVPNLILQSATFTLIDNVDGSVFSYSTPENTPIAEGSVFIVPEEVADWDLVSKTFNSMHASTITAVGSLNQENFEIEFEYIVSSKILVKK